MSRFGTARDLIMKLHLIYTTLSSDAGYAEECELAKENEAEIPWDRWGTVKMYLKKENPKIWNAYLHSVPPSSARPYMGQRIHGYNAMLFTLWLHGQLINRQWCIPKKEQRTQIFVSSSAMISENYAVLRNITALGTRCAVCLIVKLPGVDNTGEKEDAIKTMYRHIVFVC